MREFDSNLERDGQNFVLRSVWLDDTNKAALSQGDQPTRRSAPGRDGPGRRESRAQIAQGRHATQDPGSDRVTDYQDAAAQQRAIDLVGEYFCRHGSWPAVDELQRELERAGEDFDLRTALEWMDGGLGGAPSYPTATLTLAGLAKYEGAREDLSRFVDALALAYRRYASRDDDPKLRRADFVGRPRRLSSLELRKLFVLLDISSVVFAGGSGGADDDWERTIAGTVKVYREVASIYDYLAVRARLVVDRAGPRAVAERARAGWTAEIDARAAEDARRADLRQRWASRTGRAAYVAVILVIAPVVVFATVAPALGAGPSGAIAAGFVALLGAVDYLLGRGVRDAAGGLRGIVARRTDRMLLRVQFPPTGPAGSGRDDEGPQPSGE